MTETEAKQRWCPLVRANDWPTLRGALSDGAHAEVIAEAMPINRQSFSDCPDGVNDGTGINPLYACIGSACMLWRWRMSPHASTQQAIDADALDIEDDAGIEDMMKTAGDGYCGLAGKM